MVLITLLLLIANTQLSALYTISYQEHDILETKNIDQNLNKKLSQKTKNSQKNNQENQEISDEARYLFFKKIIDPDTYKIGDRQKKIRKIIAACTSVLFGMGSAQCLCLVTEWGLALRQEAESDLTRYAIAQELHTSYSLLSGMVTTMQTSMQPLHAQGQLGSGVSWSVSLPPITSAMRSARRRIKSIDTGYWYLFLCTTFISSYLCYYYLNKKYCSDQFFYTGLLAGAIACYSGEEQALIPGEFYNELARLKEQQHRNEPISETVAEEIIINWVLRILEKEIEAKKLKTC